MAGIPAASSVWNYIIVLTGRCFSLNLIAEKTGEELTVLIPYVGAVALCIICKLGIKCCSTSYEGSLVSDLGSIGIAA